MIGGSFRDGFPRVVLELPGRAGVVEQEFIVDTGFDGDLALPAHLIQPLDAAPSGSTYREMANRDVVRCQVYQIIVGEDEDGEPRFVQLLELPGNPLLGNSFLRDSLLQIEITEGGEVSATPL